MTTYLGILAVVIVWILFCKNYLIPFLDKELNKPNKTKPLKTTGGI